MAIAFFYAIGTAVGGISGPQIFSRLIATGDVTDDDQLNDMGDVALGVVNSHHYSAAHPSPTNKKFVEAFQAALEAGFVVAEESPDVLVTFGVVPTSPHTGYGYLQRGESLPGHPDVCTVRAFKEKPDRATAEHYVGSGGYWWNSGMFVWRAATLLRQVETL